MLFSQRASTLFLVVKLACPTAQPSARDMLTNISGCPFPRTLSLVVITGIAHHIVHLPTPPETMFQHEPNISIKKYSVKPPKPPEMPLVTGKNVYIRPSVSRMTMSETASSSSLLTNTSFHQCFSLPFTPQRKNAYSMALSQYDARARFAYLSLALE